VVGIVALLVSGFVVFFSVCVWIGKV
jgi:hypothetical protein